MNLSPFSRIFIENYINFATKLKTIVKIFLNTDRIKLIIHEKLNIKKLLPKRVFYNNLNIFMVTQETQKKGIFKVY